MRSRLKKTGDELIRIIAQRTGRSEEEIRNKTREDSFFAAQEAVEFGLATAVAQTLKEVTNI